MTGPETNTFIFTTALCSVKVTYSVQSGRLMGVGLNPVEKSDEHYSVVPGAVGSLVNTMVAYFEGRFTGSFDSALDLQWCTPFQRAVLDAARMVQWGEKISYSELAQRAGFPNAVRAAASVMRHNRFAIVIPCHRIICKDGATGGYYGQVSGFYAGLKKKLQSLEESSELPEPKSFFFPFVENFFH